MVNTSILNAQAALLPTDVVRRMIWEENAQVNYPIEFEFEIPGRPCPNHRPRAVGIEKTVKQGERLVTIITARIHPKPQYDRWLKKVNAYGGAEALRADWIMPAPKVRLWLYLRFYICTYRMGSFKTGKKAGQVGKIPARTPDAGNVIKGVEDGLEGALYFNDQVVTTLPWPGAIDFIERVESPVEQRTRIGIGFEPVPGGSK